MGTLLEQTDYLIKSLKKLSKKHEISLDQAIEINSLVLTNLKIDKIKNNQLSTKKESTKNKSSYTEISDAFKIWAEDYFADESNFNKKIPKDEVINDYRVKNSSKISSQRFSIKLSLYCEMKGYDFNPKEMQGKNSREQIRLTKNGLTKNCYYIRKESKNVQ